MHCLEPQCLNSAILFALMDIAVYSRRWVHLVFICMLSLLTQYISKSFGVANQIFAAYFETTLAALDWTTVGLYAGTALVTPAFAYLEFAELLGFRSIVICGTISLLIVCLVIILSVQFPVLFPALVAASFLEGVSYSVSFSVGPSFAAQWFPENQVGFAIACNNAAIYAGFGLGSLVPSLVLHPMPSVDQSSKNDSNFSVLMTANITTLTQSTWKQTTNISLMLMYSVICVVLFLSLVYFYIFATDLPPKPPTPAMYLKQFGNQLCESKSFNAFIKYTKCLFKDVNYCLCLIISGISFNIGVLNVLHTSQAIEHILNPGFYNLTFTITLVSGLIQFTYITCAAISSVVSSKTLKTFKDNYKAQVIFGSGLCVGAWICVLVSFYLKSLVLTFIGNAAFGTGQAFANIPLIDAVTRHTYPLTKRW